MCVRWLTCAVKWGHGSRSTSGRGASMSAMPDEQWSRTGALGDADAPASDVGSRLDVAQVGATLGVNDGDDEPGPPLTIYLVKQLELVVRALMDEALRP